MTPLDLRSAPPRSSRAELAGIVFLPRTLDKVRAMLPGGDLGDYTIEGFSTRMLEMTGIDLAALTERVANATNEDEIAAWVREAANPEGIAQWNAFSTGRLIYGGDRAEAEADHPWLKDRPELTHTLDFIDEDDRRSFGAATP